MIAAQPHSADPHAFAPSARFVLRDATRTDHDRVDAAYSRFDLGSAAGYARFLSAQYHAHRAVENWLAAACLPARHRLAPRSPLIAQDLESLGDTEAQARADAAPSPCVSIAGALGTLYCLAGSSFGARVLAGRLADDAPRAFLSQALPAGFWHELLGALDQTERAGHLPESIAAAQATFTQFAQSAEEVCLRHRSGAEA